MPRRSRDEEVDRRLAEEQGGAFDEMQVVVLAADADGNPTDELLCNVGGRWDEREKRYDGPAESARVFTIHPGQIEAFRWFFAWLSTCMSGAVQPAAERIYSILLAGGVRSGKTVDACLMAVAYAVARSGSIVWIVCPSDRRYEEVQAILTEDIMPGRWYTDLGAPWFRYDLINGSKIVLRSGHIPGALKNGDCDFLVINEAQQQSERVFAISRGRIAAGSGLVVCVANPPDAPIGSWVGDFAADAQAGRRQAKYFHISPLENPYIDRESLLEMKNEVDDRTFRAEVMGDFLEAAGTVFYGWDRVHNEVVPPATGEITRDFLRVREGGDFDRAVGVDMQRLPHMASVELRFWENPLAPKGDDRFQWALGWFTSEITIEAADEFDLCQAWLDAGWDPDRTLVIADASGDYQFTQRDPFKVAKLRELTGGRGSFAAFRKMGFVHVRKPDRDLEKNPDVIERCRAMSSRISTKARGPFGQRFLFSDPANRELNKAIRTWPTKGGTPWRTHQHAHRCDAASYVVNRMWPRRAVGEVDIRVVSKPDGRRRMTGW